MVIGLTAQNIRKEIAFLPVEDSLGIDDRNRFFSVADGVTRDPYEYLPDLSNFLGKVKFSWGYPRFSPAKVAADIFTGVFTRVLKNYPSERRDENLIRAAFEEANKVIGQWNSCNIPNQDYVLKDYAGCVASGAALNNGLIHIGFLSDCGVAIFDEKGDLKFRTENQGPDQHESYFWKDERLQSLDWRNPEARRIIRRNYRNNPSQEHSFGVLTGEKSAMDYVKTTTQELKPNHSLVLYTDGLEPIVFSGEFADNLRKKDTKGLEKLCKRNVETEGTLILYP
jgi:hypothetical protein